jgi:thiol-disulfide isomerase/thioredoxin
MNKFLYLLPVLLIAISCSRDGEQQDQQPQHSQMMNDVDHAAVIEAATFTDLDGNEVSLSDYHGKVLVIDFWETWCGPCLQVFPSLQDLIEEYPDDFAVLAITLGMMEGPDEARAFKEEHEYDFHYLYDEYNVSDQLGIFSIPFKMYIDPDGKLIKHEIGTRGREGDYNSAKEVITEYID